MKGLFTALFVLLQVSCAYADIVDPKCKKGFERLVILANHPSTTKEEFQESVTITDSLFANECYEYIVDKNGNIYAGATLSFLFGTISLNAEDSTAAVASYISYIKRNSEFEDKEMEQAFDLLFVKYSAIVLTEIKKDNNAKGLMERLANGFIHNAYSKLFVRINKDNYKDLFYKMHPNVVNLPMEHRVTMNELLDVIRSEVQ